MTQRCTARYGFPTGWAGPAWGRRMNKMTEAAMKVGLDCVADADMDKIGC